MEPVKVFLVDDDRVFLETLKHFLKQDEKLNLEIESYNTGEECLKKINEKPEIVILDYFLDPRQRPYLDGLNVLKKIKSSEPSTKVIMLSNQDNIDIAMDTLKYGAFDYVSKTESAFLKIRNSISNISQNLRSRKETGREVARFKKVNLLIIIIILLLFLINKILEKY